MILVRVHASYTLTTFTYSFTSSRQYRMVELLLDPAIRMWVILPIVLITLLFGLLRHYITVLLRSTDNNLTVEKVKDA